MGSSREMRRLRRLVGGVAFVLVCGLSILPADGNEVDAGRVRRMVRGWLKCNPQVFASSLGHSVASVKAHGEGESRYYAVDLEDGGLIIVPADDRVEPVLAFGSEGGYVAESASIFHKLVEADILARVAEIRSASVLPGQRRALPGRYNLTEVRERWAQLENLGSEIGSLALPPVGSVADMRIAPLIHTRWDQHTCCSDPNLACYNYFTPPAEPNSPATHGDPDNYPCGCSATALAQLMRYHETPSQGIGVHNIPVKIDNQDQYRRTLGGDGNGGPYRWDLMVDEPNCSTTDEQRRAIGALCHDMGVLSKTMYSPSVSGASSYFTAIAPAMCGFEKSMLAYDDMRPLGDAVIAMINPNLDARLPVILGMYIQDSKEGHTVIVDGYGYHNDVMYHHVNMGLGGAGNVWWNLPNVGKLSTIKDCIYNIFLKAVDPDAESEEIISGRIFDANGDPLEDAEVQAHGPDGFVQIAQSDAKGIYALWPLYFETEYTISVDCEGHVFAPRKVATGTSVDLTKKTGNRWGVDFHGVPARGGLKIWKGVYGVPAPQGGDFVKAAPGTNFGLALRADGTVAYWGVDTPLLNNLPSPNTGFVDVACGSLHCVALRNDGTIAAWGTNLSGQLNPPSHRFKAIDAMGNVTGGITESGQIVIWGQTENWEQPPIGSFKAFSLGGGFVVGLREDGSLAATGDNREGECEVPDGNDFVAIAATDAHSVALRRDGSIEAWGQDLYYNWIERCKPKGKGYIGISASRSGNCALRDDGSLVVWTSGGLQESGGRWFTVATSRYGDLATIAAPIPGDIVPDEKVDLKDLAAFSADWGRTYDRSSGIMPPDLDADGTIDIEDLLQLASFWLRDNSP